MDSNKARSTHLRPLVLMAVLPITLYMLALLALLGIANGFK